jgi:hypothetical protein
MCHLAGIIEAGPGLASLGIRGWWLPQWLPRISLASLMFERSNVVTTHDRRPTSASGFSSRMPAKQELAARPVWRWNGAGGDRQAAGFNALQDAV